MAEKEEKGTKNGEDKQKTTASKVITNLTILKITLNVTELIK